MIFFEKINSIHYNAELFNYWVEHFLLPELSPGQVVILENATFHKSKKTKHLIDVKYYFYSIFS